MNILFNNFKTSIIILITTASLYYIYRKLFNRRKPPKELVLGEDYYFDTIFTTDKGVRGEELNLRPTTYIFTNFINKSTTNLCLCFYTFNSNDFVNAVKSARSRGVHVDFILDGLFVRSDNYRVQELKNAGVNVYASYAVEGQNCLMHHKFMLRDEKHLFQGSGNPTVSSASGNFENYILTDHPDLVAGFTKIFEKMKKEFIKV